MCSGSQRSDNASATSFRISSVLAGVTQKFESLTIPKRLVGELVSKFMKCCIPPKSFVRMPLGRPLSFFDLLSCIYPIHSNNTVATALRIVSKVYAYLIA
jgi:hypothetical protein